MSEQEKKPTLEEEINEKLIGEIKDNALNFVSFLRENNITHERNGYQQYLDEDVCNISIFGKKSWFVYWNTSDVNDSDNANVSEDLKKFARNARNKCKGGHCDKSPGTSRKIFGKEYQNLCNATLAFCSPSGHYLDNIKELVKCRIRDIELRK